MPEDRELTVALTGDSIITRRVPVDRDDSTRQLVEAIRRADVAFTNLEVLPNDFRGHPALENGGTHLAAPEWVLDELVAMGFDLFGCANNHALDYSIEGLLATIETLERHRLPFAGVGRTLAEARMPAYADHHAGSVAMVACTSTFAKSQAAGAQTTEMQGRPGVSPLRFDTVYEVTETQLSQLRGISDALGLDQQRRQLIDLGFAFPPDDPDVFPFTESNLRSAGTLDANFRAGERPAVRTTAKAKDVDAIARWVREARARADVVVVSLHSHEHGGDIEVPADFAKEFAHRMVDEGADVVVGHGPHLLRGMELYRDKPIFYSLGNFVGQNELVQRLPADSYEQFRVDTAETPSGVFRSRTQSDSRSFPADPRYWETIVPICRFSHGAFTGLELLPVSLGHGQPPHRRGRPYLAPADQAAEILSRFSRLSRDLGVDPARLADLHPAEAGGG